MGSAASQCGTVSASGRNPQPSERLARGFRGLPSAVGLGLRPEHAAAWSAGVPGVGFTEIHAENYMMAGGPALRFLDVVAERYPLSLHGVALSLGGEDPLDLDHLGRLKKLIDRFHPVSFSEHLAWSSHKGIFYNDLLPVVYDTATLTRVANHIATTQEILGMRLLLENPSTYVTFASSDWDEVDFLKEIALRTGCGLLLDVNNVAVSAHNHGYSPADYIARFPHHLVGEIHIAGHDEQPEAVGSTVRIDGHGSPVSESVWNMLDQAIAMGGPRPVLLERDNAVPALEDLLPDLQRIAAVLDAAEVDHAVAG